MSLILFWKQNPSLNWLVLFSSLLAWFLKNLSHFRKSRLKLWTQYLFIYYQGNLWWILSNSLRWMFYFMINHIFFIFMNLELQVTATRIIWVNVNISAVGVSCWFLCQFRSHNGKFLGGSDCIFLADPAR